MSIRQLRRQWSSYLARLSWRAPRERYAPAAPSALLEHSKEFAQDVVRVVDGVHVAIGFGIANSILLEGREGVIVVDTMETLEAARVVAERFRRIRRAPVEAIFYTHSHPDHIGGGPSFLLPEQQIPPVYAHAGVQAAIDKTSAELQAVITRRALRMYGTELSPEARVNVGIGGELAVREGSTVGVLRPTRVFEKELVDEVAGIRFELMHAPGETDDQMMVWLPDRGVLLSGDNLYRAFPNLYTIRGTTYRDPKVWAATLDRMRALRPRFLVPSHGRPLAGEALIQSTLTDYRDAIRYVYDQTLRWMNCGLPPEAIAERVRLPPHLERSPFLQPFYGEVSWSVRSIFAGNLGWYGGQPEHLRPLPAAQRARRMAALAGGEPALIGRIVEAQRAGDHAWVLELTAHALALNPKEAQAKQARIAALEALGTREGNPNARHEYLVQAGELRGDITLPDRVLCPTPEMLRDMPLQTFFDAMPVHLNAEHCHDKLLRVGFELTEPFEQYTYIIRYGVSEVVPRLLPDLDLHVRVPAQIFKETVARIRMPELAVAKDFEMMKGSKVAFAGFMRLFQGQGCG